MQEDPPGVVKVAAAKAPSPEAVSSNTIHYRVHMSSLQTGTASASTGQNESLYSSRAPLVWLH